MDVENSYTVGKIIFAKADFHALVQLYLYVVGVAFIVFVVRVELLSILKGSKVPESDSDPIFVSETSSNSNEGNITNSIDLLEEVKSTEFFCYYYSMLLIIYFISDDDRLPQLKTSRSTIKVKKEPKAPSTPQRSPQQNLGLVLSPEGYRKSARLMQPSTNKETSVKGRRKSII
jgi:hypothetical protein